MRARLRGAQNFSAVLCALFACGWAANAAAYCRTMSCELGEDPAHPCPRDAQDCVTQGQPLHWASACLRYSVQVDGSPLSGLDADQVQVFVAQAFKDWQSATCPGGGSPRFEAQFQGFVSCNRRESVCGGADKNVNVVMFHDQGWTEGPSRIGLTTPMGGVESGVVLDADVEINSQDYSFKADATGMMSTSLRYVLTHELGHFLGLAHSQVSGAVMSTGYQSEPRSRSLISADDAAAICAAFPPGPALSCGTPPAPAYDACALKPGEQPPCKLASVTQDARSCGCHLADSSRSRSLSPFAALGLLFCGLASRRVRRKRAARA